MPHVKRSRFKGQTLYVCQCISHGCSQNEAAPSLPDGSSIRGRILPTLEECCRHTADDNRRHVFKTRSSISDEEEKWSLHRDDGDRPEAEDELSELMKLSNLNDEGRCSPAMVISSLEAELTAKRTAFGDYHGPLVFKHPRRLDELRRIGTESPLSSLLELSHSDPANSSFLKYHAWLTETIKQLNVIMIGCQDDDALRKRGDALLAQLCMDEATSMDFRLEHWRNQISKESHTSQNRRFDVDTQIFIQSSNILHMDVVNLVCYLLMATLSLICHVSNAHCNFAISVLNFILRITQSSSTDPLPKDIRTFTGRLDLEPTFKTFICCVACYKCYEMSPAQEALEVPTYCTHRELPDGESCGQLLQKRVRHGVHRRMAFRRYLHHDLKDWMGRLLCRPGMEVILDTEPFPDPRKQGAIDIHYTHFDIWDGDVLRSLKGPDGQPFIHGKRKASEGRYVFSLCMDGFNPFHSKEAGKKYSTGAMYMVCLNLPPALRYRMENVFVVGVMPGPTEPRKEQINHVLAPLVDDLLVFFQQGIRYSSTPAYPKGRKVCIALGPLVCDLPAARQMAGFASHSHAYFCSVCKLHKDDIDSISDSLFVPRSNTEHRQQAEEWRTATSGAERDDLYASRGVRYSELLRLPYWKPVLMTLIDTMHCLFLCLLKRHCRNIFGMDIKLADGDGSPQAAAEAQCTPTESDMDFARKVLRYGSDNAVRKLSRNVMLNLCEEFDLPERKRDTKKYLICELLNFRLRMSWFNAEGALTIDLESQRIDEQLDVTEERLEYAMYLFDYVAFSEKSRGGVASLNVPTLIALCKHYVPNFKHSFSPLPTKSELLSVLVKRRRELYLEAQPVLPKIPKPPRTRVLGRTMLPEIWQDMDKTTLPSWLSAGPKEVGTARCGKLSADQWRTTCTVHLVITLGRIWGRRDANDRFYAMHSNFMDLVTATKLATMRSLTSDRILQYENYIRRYLGGIKSLYKHHFSPYQHLSLHLGDMLRRFGPVHAWRSYPFERWNYVMQSINTNMRSGDLEVTMFQRFCRMQRLFAYWTSQDLPPGVAKSLLHEFQKAFQSDRRGTLQSDLRAMHDPSSKFFGASYSSPGKIATLPPQHADLLYNAGYAAEQVKTHRSFQYRGVEYRAHKGMDDTFLGDSLVVVGTDIQSPWEPGRIEAIYETPNSQPKVLVRMYEPLSRQDAIADPYRRYSIAGGRVYYLSFQSPLRMVSPGDLLSHFALTPNVIDSIVRPHMHVLPLDRD